MGRRQVELARVDFCQMREQIGRGRTVPGDVHNEITQQHVIVEMGERVSIHGASAHAFACIRSRGR